MLARIKATFMLIGLGSLLLIAVFCFGLLQGLRDRAHILMNALGSIAKEKPWEPIVPQANDSLGELEQNFEKTLRLLCVDSDTKKVEHSKLESDSKNLERKLFEHNVHLSILRRTRYELDHEVLLSEVSEQFMNSYDLNFVLVHSLDKMGELIPLFLKEKSASEKKEVASHKGRTITFGTAQVKINQEYIDLSRRSIAGNLVLTKTVAQGMSPDGIQLISIPIRDSQNMCGVITMVADTSRIHYGGTELAFLDLLKRDLDAVFEAARRNDTRLFDQVTHLYNHTYFETQLTIEVMRARRTNSSLALVLIDIDNFHDFRDEEKVAKEVLVATAEIIQNICRTTDITARTSEQQFSLILPETPEEGATVVARKVQKMLEENITNTSHGPVTFTASVGLAMYPIDANIPKDLSQMVRLALKNAQDLGGNRYSRPNS